MGTQAVADGVDVQRGGLPLRSKTHPSADTAAGTVFYLKFHSKTDERAYRHIQIAFTWLETG